MKIWYGAILVTTVILTGYLVIVIDKNIPAINQNIAESEDTIKALQEQLAKQNTLVEALQSEVKVLSKNINKEAVAAKPVVEDKYKTAILSLRASVGKIADAYAKINQGDVNAAVEILKSVKQTLWQASNVLIKQQSALRALMGPIDGIIGEWKKGNKAADTSKITNAVNSILDNLNS